MAGAGAGPAAPAMRLKEWLIAQVESGRYPGLRWEDPARRLFRIPWKHAAKQDYRQRQDAALFKAWAIYKGKYHEGLDKADPSVWKTRLRCALNKSSDFREVPERSHLDISEPYKVYQIVSEEAAVEETPELPLEQKESSIQGHQIGGVMCKPNKARRSSESGHDVKHKKVEPRQISPLNSQPTQMSNPTEYQNCHVKGRFYSWNPSQLHFHPAASFVHLGPLYADNGNINSDCWLHICLYYFDVLVKEVTTTTVEGCRLTYGCVPADNERLYGANGMEQIHFPSPEVLGFSKLSKAVGVLERLLPHLHRGLLLWVAPEGVFMKRQCQGRVYWKGPLAPYEDQPNKMERERTYKILDTRQFLQQLQGYLSHGDPLPQYQIHLCFGEEFPAAPNQRLHKFIMAQVEPVFARELCLHAQRLGPRSLRGLQASTLDVPRNFVQILKQLCPP